MKRIYLVRHCKAVGQEPDAPLTEEGVRQSRELVSFFLDKKVEHIRSSPYTRAMDTIKPLADTLNLAIHTDGRLRERVLATVPLGDWMNRLKDTFLDEDLMFEGGESSREAAQRGMDVIRELLGRPEQTFVVVTHGGLMSLLIRRYDPAFGFDDWMRMANPDVYELEVREGGASIKRCALTRDGSE
jgi:2,3-bisphosphoglycerate-dependent phosphoglycerate mutase